MRIYILFLFLESSRLVSLRTSWYHWIVNRVQNDPCLDLDRPTDVLVHIDEIIIGHRVVIIIDLHVRRKEIIIAPCRAHQQTIILVVLDLDPFDDRLGLLCPEIVVIILVHVTDLLFEETRHRKE